MTTTSLNTPNDYATHYLKEFGFSVFVIRNKPPASRKMPAVLWDLYQIMRASQIQIDRWFAKNPNYNIAVVTGNISKIIAVDVDGPTAAARLEEKIPEMSTNLRVAITNTMVNRTGSGGTHIVFRIEEPTDISQKTLWKNDEAHSEIKVQGNDHYVVMPPSVHPNGNRYEWNGKGPILITKQELKELIRVLSNQPLGVEYVPSTRSIYESTETGELRTLNPEQMQELLYWVTPYYSPGSRNDIIFSLSGMFRLGGFTHETARAFMQLLCDTLGYPDENLVKSLDVVANTYEKPIEHVKGKSGLHVVLVTSHADTPNTEEYLKRTEHYARICQILNPPPLPPPPPPPPADSGASSGSTFGQQKGETDKENKVRGLTETLEHRYHFAAMDDTDELFYYNDRKGKYEPAEALVKARLENLYPGVITDTVTNVIEKLARRHLHMRTEFDSDLYILNMANGLYDIRTNTLKPHTPEYLSLRQYPIKFDPKIRPKKFGKFLSEVLYANQVRTAVEALGYTFWRDNPSEIYIILLGFGSNGKSVLMHVLTKLHGEDNVSNTSLTNLLSNRFAKKELEGKNVNIDMEMSKATIEDMSVLKELTGSQPIRIEPKYLQAYTTRLWAKHFFSTNEMPEMKDYTDAHYRREVIISFPNQFVEGENANPNLKNELTTEEELSGIFNALMIPLRRIALEQKAPYMDAKTIQERKLKHQLITDPIKAFLDTAVEPTDYESDTDIRKEDLYEGYKKFCAFYKLPWQKYDPFCKIVKAKGTLDGRETSGDRKPIWKGIRLKKHLFQDPLTV